MRSMRSVPETIALRPNERLRYWRHHDLGDATLMQAHYGPFVWEKHVHDEQVVVVSEQGIGEVTTRRGREAGGEGTVWVFSPGEYHFGKVDSGREWRYRALYLDQAALSRISAHLGSAGRGLLLKAGLHHDPAMARLLLQAHALESGDLASEQVSWNDAFAALFARYGDPRPRFEPTRTGVATMDAVRDYIGEYFRGDLAVDELAALAGLSRYHFIRAFRCAFGLPPHAYVNQLRLQHARKLLLAGRTAAEAASESGFYDQSSLNKLFRRAYGVTPARYAHLIRL